MYTVIDKYSMHFCIPILSSLHNIIICSRFYQLLNIFEYLDDVVSIFFPDKCLSKLPTTRVNVIGLM